MKKKLCLVLVMILLLISYTACNNIKAASGENIVNQPAEGQESQSLYPAYIIKDNQKLWGYINEEGKFIIEPQFDNAGNFQANGIAAIQKDGMTGLIDLKGQIILEPSYSAINDYENGYAIANKDWKEYAIIDEKGKVLYSSENLLNSIKDGIAAFGKSMGEWEYLFGYMKVDGSVIIEPQYIYAGEFQNGKALVGLEEGKYAIIDKDGNKEFEFNSKYTPQISENIIVFNESDGNYGMKYGYMNMDGTMLMEDMFNQAEPFNNGLAIVQSGEADVYEYRLIDKEGKVIIKSSGITSIGNNYYSVAKNSDVFSNYFSNMYYKNALFKADGTQITDYSYYNIQRINDEYISVCDETTTFIINNKGEIAKEYPKQKGIGSISSVGNLFKAEVDQEDVIYFDKTGKIIWASDNKIALDNGITIEKQKFRPDRYLLISYPKIEGIKNQETQNKINDQIKGIFLADIPESDEEYIADSSVSFEVQNNKDLLIILKSGYYYPLGAAHGGAYIEYYYFDINSGKEYKLSDLFKKDSDYKGALTKIINKRIKKANEKEMAYFDTIQEIRENQEFEITKDYVKIYFQQYEIAPYAAGFPSFEIAYGDIIDIIDTEGEFWNSFDKKIEASKTASADNNQVPSEIKDSIAYLLNSYESNLVEAINTNSFELVKGTLLEGSELYKSQEKLTANLYSKGIKERIDDYQIKNIVKDNDKYLVYVEETIGIQYPGKEFEVKLYSWIYTVVHDEAGNYLLSGIEKWVKQ